MIYHYHIEFIIVLAHRKKDVIISERESNNLNCNDEIDQRKKALMKLFDSVSLVCISYIYF